MSIVVDGEGGPHLETWNVCSCKVCAFGGQLRPGEIDAAPETARQRALEPPTVNAFALGKNATPLKSATALATAVARVHLMASLRPSGDRTTCPRSGWVVRVGSGWD
jgi:hypothetical protein